MKIIFLTLVKIRDKNQTDIYSSLMREFAKHGHAIYIVSPVERRENDNLKNFISDNIHYHYASIGNYYNTPWIEKGVTTVTLQRQYIKTIKEELSNVRFDLILYATPPVTFAGVIRFLKEHNNAKTFLMLKDVWPQSMKDMETLKDTGMQGIVYKYFKCKEKEMYRLSDYIGCMSPACAKYMLENNPEVSKERVSVCPNALNFDDGLNHVELSEMEKKEIREKYNIPSEKIIFVFGGNIGNGHDPDFLEESMRLNEKRMDSFILFVGKGVYFDRINGVIHKENLKNSKIIPYLPQEEYIKLMAACDVGMITLDHRFTCPNYPSRLMSYLVDKKPVIIAQDNVSDVGPIAEKNGYGYWCRSTEPEKYISLMDNYVDDNKRKEMGHHGYEFLRKNYNTEKVYEIIMSYVGGEKER